MTLQEFARKRVKDGLEKVAFDPITSALSYLVPNALFHTAGRVYLKKPHLMNAKTAIRELPTFNKISPTVAKILAHVISAPGALYKNVTLDATHAGFMGGLRGRPLNELKFGRLGSALPSLGVEIGVAHELGSALRSQGIDEKVLTDLPKTLRRASLVAKLAVPVSTAALGAGSGALLPSVSNRANEMGLPTPIQKDSHRKRNALIGAAVGGAAGFGGGALGWHNYLGPFNLLRGVAQRATGTSQTAESAAGFLGKVVRHKPTWVGKMVTKGLTRGGKAKG